MTNRQLRSDSLNQKFLKRSKDRESFFRKYAGQTVHSETEPNRKTLPDSESANSFNKLLNSFCKNISILIDENENIKYEKVSIHEWKLVGIILDRFFFWIFFLVTLIVTITLLIVIPLLKNIGYFKK